MRLRRMKLLRNDACPMGTFMKILRVRRIVRNVIEDHTSFVRSTYIMHGVHIICPQGKHH